MREARGLLLMLVLGGACHAGLSAGLAQGERAKPHAAGGRTIAAKPGWEVRLAPPGEPGQPVVVEGVVRRHDGSPAAGVMLYLHHANHQGVYPPRSDAADMHRPGYLSGWIRTDEAGRYRVLTVRPGTPAGSAAPARVHVRLHRADRAAYPLADFVFADDPRATPAYLRRAAVAGDGGLVRGRLGADGVWRGTRTLVLPRDV